jgi:FkbM family methyltransferase
MRIGNRSLSAALGALFQPRHHVAARNMLRAYRNPADAFARYLLGRGSYPAVITLNTPAGALALTIHSYDDILTVNEIFCRLDYPAAIEDRIVVDFGSNIGLSAAFFLSRNPDAFVYLYEPLPANIGRLRENLKRFESRYALHEVAVGREDGVVEFGWEATGRYGGVGVKTGSYVSVACRDSNKILAEAIDRHGRIDVLKIDIEGLEREVTQQIPVEIARRIRRLYVEHDFASNPLAETHSYRQYGAVAQFTNREMTAC